MVLRSMQGEEIGEALQHVVRVQPALDDDGQASPGELIGIVTLSDCKLFSACLLEAKPLTLRRAAIDNLPRFGVNPVNVTKPFAAFLHEVKPLKSRRAGINNLPRFRGESG